MNPELLEFAHKLAEGARAKALEDLRRLEAIREARARAENTQGLKPSVFAATYGTAKAVP